MKFYLMLDKKIYISFNIFEGRLSVCMVHRRFKVSFIPVVFTVLIRSRSLSVIPRITYIHEVVGSVLEQTAVCIAGLLLSVIVMELNFHVTC